MKPTLRNYAKLHGYDSVPLQHIDNGSSVEDVWKWAPRYVQIKLCRDLLTIRQLKRYGWRAPDGCIPYLGVPPEMLQKELELFFSAPEGILFRYRGAPITFHCALSVLRACRGAKLWVGRRSLEEAWEKCRDKEWMWWLVQVAEEPKPLSSDLDHMTPAELRKAVPLPKLRRKLIKKVKECLRAHGC